MTRLVPLATFMAWFWWLAPRVWHRADRSLTRRRLASHRTNHDAHETLQATRPTHVPASLDRLSAVARDTAQSMRSGEVAGVALSRALVTHAPGSHTMHDLARDLDRAVPLADVFAAALARRRRHVGSPDHETRFVSLLAAGTVDTLLTPTVVERAADVLDDLAAREADVRIAGAHASLTVRFLTALPAGVAVLALLTSGELRSSWRHPAVVVPCVIGIALHATGRVIVRRIVAAVVESAREPEGAASRLADTLAAGLAAGLSPAAACARLDLDPDCGDTARAVVVALRSGAPLSVSLGPLASDAHTVHVAETLLATAHAGTGGADAATRLADHSRRHRAEHTRAAVAALPGRLSVPVTLFVLPSFLVGVLVPVVATGARFS